jgi:hypothetical protein
MAESEIGRAQGGEKATELPRTWRSTVLAIGMFCVLGALGVGAAMKGEGSIQKILGLVGLILIGISIVGSIVASISSRVKGGQADAAQSKS